MKPKPKLRARRFWVNYYPYKMGIFASLHRSRARALIGAGGFDLWTPIPVAVIPLDDTVALTSTAFNAYCEAQDANRDSIECVVAALAAIGVLPKKRKGRK